MNTLENFVEKPWGELFIFSFAAGYLEGYRIGYQEGTKENIENLIKQSVLTDDQIASAMDVDLSYVAQIRKDIAAE